MFFSSVALTLLAPVLCLGMPAPAKKATDKATPSVKGKPACNNNASSFSLLTYNVAGLPEIINTNSLMDKQSNAITIGKKLKEHAYDVIHLQEDFHLHQIIWLNDNHNYHTHSAGPVMDGDGLNTISNHDGYDFDRYTWAECSLNGGDCLTPKGFTHMTTKIEGVHVDMYNLHADAGNQHLDRKARSMGFDQLLAHVDKHTKGRPVILAGDFNDRWADSKRSINKLTDAGFKDAWVKLYHNNTIPEPSKEPNECEMPPKNNTCEVVDKVFYRSGNWTKLDVVSFNYESKIFVTQDKEALSDHIPIRVDFTWSPIK
ncbi:hypothetical protein ACHAPT_010453 [Fusarium lateritium]